MSAEFTRITSIGFVSNDSQTTLLCNLLVIFIVALKKCAVFVNADFSFYSWQRVVAGGLLDKVFGREEKKAICANENRAKWRQMWQRKRGRHSTILAPNAGRGMAWGMKRKWWGAQRRKAPDEMIAGEKIWEGDGC